MGSLYDYLKWRGDLSFSQSEINEVDSLIFSLLSYVDFYGVVSPSHDNIDALPLRSASNRFFAQNPDEKKISMGVIVPKQIITLLRLVKETPRFRNVMVKAHVNAIDLDRQMQFSATTFVIDDKIAVVTFRGTDDTLVGWKENFNMSFMDSVPAQREAASYLETAAENFTGDLYVTGHSKGGNLAVYAAVHCSANVQGRLIQVWSNDGPGFRNTMLSNPSYIRVRPVIRTLIPESSLVGILLEHEENYIVVKSRQKGALQHDGLTWEVMGASFVHLETVSQECKRFDRDLNGWIQIMSLEQREQFTEALYQLLSIEDALTLTDLVSVKKLWKSKGRELDPQVYKTLKQTLSVLVSLSAKNFIGGIVPKRRK